MPPVDTDRTIPSNQPIRSGPTLVVLLAVTPQQAEVVRFAQLDGNVSLVLALPADRRAADTATLGITLQQLVDQYGVLPPRPSTRHSLTIASGDGAVSDEHG